MKTILLLGLCLGFVGSVQSVRPSDLPDSGLRIQVSGFSEPRLLSAIAAVETGAAWNGKPGPAGELSAWQITPAVWRQHSRHPFAQARDPAHARAVAALHLQWLAAGLQRNGHAVTPASLGTAWNVGLSRFLRTGGRITDHGQRIANLYTVTP